jgi:hypothetical protein
MTQTREFAPRPRHRLDEEGSSEGRPGWPLTRAESHQVTVGTADRRDCGVTPA